ncbi:Fic family protein [Candidatus Woesearchaeota archaeon]|nr:Fic family protein [Candidatus Woesearchaeota archaeon]
MRSYETFKLKKRIQLEDLVINYFENGGDIIPSYDFSKRLILNKNLGIFSKSKKNLILKIIDTLHNKANEKKSGLAIGKLFKDTLHDEMIRHCYQIEQDLRRLNKSSRKKLEDYLFEASRFLFNKLKTLNGLIGTNIVLETNAKVRGLKIVGLRPDYRNQKEISRVIVGNYRPPNKRISYLLEDLLAFLNSNRYYNFKKEKDRYIITPKKNHLLTLERAFLSHLHFVLIHPFFDGNGREARLLQITLLKLNNLLPVGVPFCYSDQYLSLLDKYTSKHEQEIKDYYYLIGKALEEKQIPKDYYQIQIYNGGLQNSIITRYLKPLNSEREIFSFLSDLFLLSAIDLFNYVDHPVGNALKEIKKRMEKKKNYTNPYSKHH